MSAEMERFKYDRAVIACRTCRRRKVKCTGGHPCMHCLRLSKECSYPPKQRRRATGKPQSSDFTAEYNESIDETGHVSESPTYSMLPRTSQRNRDHLPPATPQGALPGNEGDLIIGGTAELEKESLCAATSTGLPGNLHGFTPGLDTWENLIDTSPTGFSISVDSPSTPGRNLQGGDRGSYKGQDFSTWLSTCSEPGVSWICEATGSRIFSKYVERFIKSVDNLLSPRVGLTLSTHCVEPSEALAWEYVNAFFDNCWEARLGLISRSDFEAQLQAHFCDENPSHNDYAAYALRNVVFAAGRRSLQAQSGIVSYSTAQEDAWHGCFSNALSVLAGLLLSPPHVTVVQALALMTCYVEGLGRPGFQRTLCDNAVRATLTQGLHQQEIHPTSVPSDESVKRSWLWWSIYILEKHIAFVSGSPSVIDDSTITTAVPSEMSLDSNIDVEFLTLALRHSRICSRIARELMPSRARRMPADALRKVVKDFDQQIQDIIRDLPPRFQIGTLTKLSTEIQRMPHRHQSLYLHFSIYGSLLAVHSQFFYPWLYSKLLEHDRDSVVAMQVEASSNIVVEAARKILVALRALTTDTPTPTWMAFYYPIYAHLSLLIHVLRHPTLPTTRADLGLLDVCAGHFGYIEFITTSGVSISLPRESVNLAAKVVKTAERSQEHDRAGPGNRGPSNMSVGISSKPSS